MDLLEELQGLRYQPSRSRAAADVQGAGVDAARAVAGRPAASAARRGAGRGAPAGGNEPAHAGTGAAGGVRAAARGRKRTFDVELCEESPPQRGQGEAHAPPGPIGAPFKRAARAAEGGADSNVVAVPPTLAALASHGRDTDAQESNLATSGGGAPSQMLPQHWA